MGSCLSLECQWGPVTAQSQLVMQANKNNNNNQVNLYVAPKSNKKAQLTQRERATAVHV